MGSSGKQGIFGNIHLHVSGTVNIDIGHFRSGSHIKFAIIFYYGTIGRTIGNNMHFSTAAIDNGTIGISTAGNDEYTRFDLGTHGTAALFHSL